MGNQEILNKKKLTLEKEKRLIFNSYIIGCYQVGTNILLLKFVKNSSSEFSLM